MSSVVVHHRKLSICDWTGETIEKVFRIPFGPYEWGGSYGSPSVAISAILEISQESGMTQELVQELLDDFQATLKRDDEQGHGPFTISPAPSYKNLKTWGGQMTLEEYHQRYDHDTQIRLYCQKFPEDKDQREALYGTMQWTKKRKLSIPTVYTRDVRVPKGLKRCLKFLKYMAGSDQIVLGLHPSKPMFVVGQPDRVAHHHMYSPLLDGLPITGKKLKLIHKDGLL